MIAFFAVGIALLLFGALFLGGHRPMLGCGIYLLGLGCLYHGFNLWLPVPGVAG